MILATQTMSELFFNSASAFGSMELFALLIIIVLAFLMLLLNIPAIFVFMASGLVAVGFSATGGLIKILISLSAVVLGTILAFTVWNIFKKGD